MHPELTYHFALDHNAALRRDAARYRRARPASLQPPQPVRAAIQLRLSGGDWLVADLNGVPVAAVSLESGATVYDPFKPTSQAVSLLELRRKQVLAAA